MVTVKTKWLILRIGKHEAWKIDLKDLLTIAKGTSRSEAGRLIKQGGVSIDIIIE